MNLGPNFHLDVITGLTSAGKSTVLGWVKPQTIALYSGLPAFDTGQSVP